MSSASTVPIHRAFSSSLRERKRRQACVLCHACSHTAQASRRQVLSGSLQAALTAAWASALACPAAEASLLGIREPLRILGSEEVSALQPVLRSLVTKTKAPVLLRLVFHDAGTYDASDGSGGLNGSIQFELERRENAGLKRGWSTVVEAQKKLRGSPAEALSAADLVALLGAQAVSVTGGPTIPVSVGRGDAAGPDPSGRLPDENASIEELKACFARQGFTPRELVCLSGAHTLGSKGFGDPGRFDNAYFTTLLQHPWLNRADSMAAMIGLPSDHILPDDGECARAIEVYAKSQATFHRDFGDAYVKLTNLGSLA